MAQTTSEQNSLGETAAVKRRAPAACTCCRAAKVKCDVFATGVPCSNCSIRRSECVVSDRRRKRFCGTALATNHSQASSDNAEEQMGDQERGSVIDAFLAKAPISLDFKLEDYLPGPPTNAMTEPKSPIDPTLASNLGLQIQTSYAPRQSRDAAEINLQLPKYIRDLPTQFEADDIEFLKKKGVLTLPKAELRDKLLRSYVQFVHPFLPVLDLDEFLSAVGDPDESTQLSLLLFHAAIFAASAYVELPVLRMEGYEDRKSARKAFFQKAKLLYDFGYESDQTTLVQSLLLMTYWYSGPADQKDAWHWMGISLSYAQAMGLHRYSNSIGMDPKKRRLLKRLWWSCFMRDRLIALSSRRPLRLKEDDFDVPMLVLSDFEVAPLSQRSISSIDNFLDIANIEKRRTLAKLCIEKVKLCICIGHVITVQYSLPDRKPGSMARSPILLMPNLATDTVNMSEVFECDQELNEWQANLPPDCRFGRFTNECSDKNSYDELIVYSATLSMIHSTTVSALHRPQILPTLPPRIAARSFQPLSHLRVEAAAADVTEVAQYLEDQNLTRFLPPIGVTALIPAVLVHLFDTKSNDVAVRDTNYRRLHRCTRILQQLRQTYSAADSALSFLEATFQSLKLHIPQGDGHGTQQGKFFPNIPSSRPHVQAFDVNKKGANVDELSSTIAQRRVVPDIIIPETLTAGESPFATENMRETNEDLNFFEGLQMFPDDGFLHLDIDWAVDFLDDFT